MQTAIIVLLVIFVLLVFMYTRAFQIAEVPMKAAPGFKKRFNVYFNSHVSETTDNPFLPEMTKPQFNTDADNLYKVMEKGIKNLGWIIVTADPAAREIKAIVQTKLLKFKDDIKVIAEADGNNSKLYAWSSSRIGIGDMGANQKHIFDLVGQIKNEID